MNKQEPRRNGVAFFVPFEDSLTRIYKASREPVFEAWVETSQVKKWWSCVECTSVRSEIEPCVGGKYDHHMTIEGVGEVPGFATIAEYDPPKRLAYKTELHGNSNVQMIAVVDFTEVDDGTQVQLVHSGIPNTQVDGHDLREIVQAGWSAAFGKLDQFLETEFVNG